MRKRIWRMSEDQFDTEIPEIEYSDDRIYLEGYHGEKIEGSFSIRSKNNVPMKGVIYSSHPYVVVSNPQFEGDYVTIRFSLFNKGFKEDDRIEGSFCIVINGSESRLPFCVVIRHRFPESSIGRIESMEQFVELCKAHWSEAQKLFFSKRFYSFIKSCDIKTQLLYRGYRRAIPSSSNLEEFLISIMAKKPVSFCVDETQREYYGVVENIRETIEIKKSDWGYIEIDIKSDADFLTVEKERVSTDFFLGNTMQLGFYIHKDKLHSGRNYARVSFSSLGETREIIIMATSRKEEDDYMPSNLLMGKRIIRLTRLYEQYRQERVTSAGWAKGSVEILDNIIGDIEGDNRLYQLMKAHALIVGRKKQEALWIIQEMRHDIEDKKGREWAYLLYLCTLIEKEEAYVDRLTREIEIIFRDRPDDAMIFWFLLFLRREYIDDGRRKLVAIRQWIMAGYTSIFLYIEAYYLYCQDPFLFTEFDDFSMQMIRWAIRRGALRQNIAMQFTHVLEGVRSYSDSVFKLARDIYRLYPTEDLLVDVTSYLLKNHKYGSPYLEWYKMAIDKEMNFTGLYEAFILSLPRDHVEKLPHIVVMYFRYQNTLPVDKKAFVYANVITHYINELRIYEQYIRNIERFALEQMRHERIDDNLAIIYQHIFFERGVIDSDVADAMSRLLFYVKIICLYPDVHRVLIFEEQLKSPLIVPIEEYSAFAPIYSKNYQVFLEDKRGRLLTDPRGYYIEPLLHGEKSYTRMKSMASDRLGYFLHDLDQRQSPYDFSISDINDIITFLNAKSVDESYRTAHYPIFVEFLREHGKEEILADHFLSLKNYDGLDSQTLSYVIDLHIVGEKFDEAYNLMKRYNGTLVAGKTMLRLVDHRIASTDERADDFLIALCTRLMRRFLSSEDTIRYMNRYFIGPTPDMMTLWQFAFARSLDTRALEERILTQMLYTENIDVTSESIFSEYLKHHPNRMLKEAYLTYWSHKYLVSKEKVPESVFSFTLEMAANDERQNDSTNVALMKFLSKKQELSAEEFKVLDQLVASAMISNIYFDFFKEMDNRLIIKYHLYDKLFAQYSGRERRHLIIRYKKNDEEWASRDMIEMYHGIYLRQFVIFFGDSIRYEIIDAEEPDKVLKTDALSFPDVLEGRGENRYERINRMASSYIYFDEKELITEIKEYESLEQATRKLFTML